MEREKRSGTQAHEPVLLQEVLQYLDPKPGEFIIDGTVDGGGHATEIKKRILPGGLFLGMDWDLAMIERHQNAPHGKNERYVHGNYATLPRVLEEEHLGKADGLLLDLGFSSEQLAVSGRGFSFSEAAANEPLLMTYDDARVPVREFLPGLSEADITTILYEFGGERMSRRIAKAIVARERRRQMTTSGELAETVRTALPKNYERGRIDPATRTFQAFRIYANDELGNMTRTLQNIGSIVRPGGRAVVITFHSLEDGIVKRTFKALAKEGAVELLIKKPITATREEVQRNPRSRSAKLRAVQVRG